VWADLRNLFWLQWRLTLGSFRSRRARHRLRAVAQVLQAARYVFTFPVFAALGVAAAVGLALLSTEAAFAAAVAINLGLAFLWLLSPLFEESRVIERFDLTRLVQYPLSAHTLALGSASASAISLIGLATVPIMLGQWVGLALHNLLGLPLIGIGAACSLSMLVLVGRVVSDLFDVATHSRRWRGVLVTLLSLPLIGLWLVQAFLPALGQQVLHKIVAADRLAALSEAEGPSAFLEALRLVRLAGLIPVSWPAVVMGRAAQGAWPDALLFALLSMGAIGALYFAHLALTQRIMRGELLRARASRVRSATWDTPLPLPHDLATLLRKDWLYLWRSPFTRRFLIITPVMSLLMAFLFLGVLQAEQGLGAEGMREGLVLAFGLGWPAFVGMILNVSLTANYFGAADREGLGTLLNSGVDRRYVLLSAALVSGALTVTLSLVPLAASVPLGLPWTVVPFGLCAGVCMQLVGTPALLLASIVGPYRAEWRIASQASGNLWGLVAWLASIIPIATLVIPAWLLARPALWVVMPTALVLGAAATALSLKPLARLFLRREHDVLEAVTREE